MRLIDADALWKAITIRIEEYADIADIMEIIEMQPIIEERETERWIPVTEALPNTPIKHPSRYGVGEYCESKPLIFQLVNKEDDDIFYTGMLSGCYCDDLNGYTYFVTADACSFEIEKVAAWMPLPEPYEGGK